MTFMTEARTLVDNCRKMTDEVFCLHWNKRHKHLEAHGHELGKSPSDNATILKLYRTYHDTIHKLEVGEVFDHVHRP